MCTRVLTWRDQLPAEWEVKSRTYLVRVSLEDLDNLPPAIVSDRLATPILLAPSGRGRRIGLEPFFQVLVVVKRDAVQSDQLELIVNSE